MTLIASLPRYGALGLMFILTGCALNGAADSILREEAQVAEKTPTQKLLEKLPPAQAPVVLSVYEFQDQTGAQKPNDNFADFSRAVTQGGVNMLYKALMDAGHGSWFTVIERAGLKNLQNERGLVRAMREQYSMPNGGRLPDVDPLLYAGVLLEGGIVAYDSNITTGGAGAAYLGITANTQYRRDMVTIYLRAVSVQNGEVLASVNTTKTIFSTAVQANVFKYVAFDELLEGETGFSVNEPPQMAVRQAIEYGVYSLVMEGAIKGLWGFQNPNTARDQLRKYMKVRDGEMPNDAEVNRILGVSGPAPLPVPAQDRRPEPVPAPIPPVAPAPRPEVRSPQASTAAPDVYAAPSAPQQPSVSQAQMPEKTQYVPPPPGQKAPEDKIVAKTYTPEPQLFKSNAGGPVYDVICTTQGCFPSTATNGNTPQQGAQGLR